jgi:hypothetical protein
MADKFVEMDWMDEGRIEYSGNWSFKVVWDYLDKYRIAIKLLDKYNTDNDERKETCIQILQEQNLDGDSAWIDVTDHFFLYHQENKSLKIRPTLDNLREIMRILEENVYGDEPS